MHQKPNMRMMEVSKISLKKKHPKKTIINQNKLKSSKRFKPWICLNAKKQTRAISLWPVSRGWVP